IMWVLDTDTIALWFRGHPSVVQKIEEQQTDQLAITIITVEEVLTGWYRLIRLARNDDKIVRAYQSLQESIEFFKRVRILPFGAAALAYFHDLRREHRLIGTNDLRIAAIVLERGAALASRNLKDFRKIAELEVQDWAVGL